MGERTKAKLDNIVTVSGLFLEAHFCSNISVCLVLTGSWRGKEEL